MRNKQTNISELNTRSRDSNYSVVTNKSTNHYEANGNIINSANTKGKSMPSNVSNLYNSQEISLHKDYITQRNLEPNPNQLISKTSQLLVQAGLKRNNQKRIEGMNYQIDAIGNNLVDYEGSKLELVLKEKQILEADKMISELRENNQ